MSLHHELDYVIHVLRSYNAAAEALLRAQSFIGDRSVLRESDEHLTRRLKALSLNELGELAKILVDAKVHVPLDAAVQQFVYRPAEGSKLVAVEKAIITHAVKACDGNVSAAARLLNADRKMLDRRWRKMRSA